MDEAVGATSKGKVLNIHRMIQSHHVIADGKGALKQTVTRLPRSGYWAAHHELRQHARIQRYEIPGIF